MNKLLIASLIALSLSGCATTGPNTPVTTPATLVAQFCPLVQSLNTQISTFPGVSANVVSDLDKARPIIAAVCTEGATITALNLQSLASDAVPALLDIIEATPAAATPQGQAIIVGLDLVQTLLPEVIADINLVK